MDIPDRGPAVLVVTVVTICIGTVFVVGRLVSRAGILKHMTLDDYLIIVAWVLSFAISFVIAFATGKGLGKRDVDIKPEWMLALKKCEYAFSVIYNPALMAIKTSLLVLYLRLSRATNKLFRITTYATLALTIVGLTVLTFLNVFQCDPVSKTFNMHDNAEKCIPLITLFLASSPLTIITDVIILVLPIPILTGMQMPQRQKNILVFTFGLGIFVTIVDVIRIYYLQQAMTDVLSSNQSRTHTARLGDEKDFAYLASFSLMWSAVEVNVGLVCACIPTLKPVVKRILPMLLEPDGRHSSDRTHTGSGTKNVNTSSNEPAILEFLGRSSPAGVGAATQPSQDTTLTGSEQPENEMVDFITMAGMEGNASTAKKMSCSSNSQSVYFGFVNIRRPKCMLNLSHKDSWRYCTAVTILFFLWGFSYGLLNTLNSQIVAISHSSPSQGVGLLSAYFGAYLFGPTTLGRYALTKGGFKATFIVGLCVYGTGTLMFWPSAVLVSFPGFVISNFVVGFGLSVLETAANPFLALCGPPEHGEMRLLLAQGMQGVGSVVSQLIAEKAFFKQVSEHPNLIGVQWVYLAVAFLSVILGLFFYYMPLPEATDEELQRAVESRSLPINRSITEPRSYTHIGVMRVVYLTLFLGVLAQFFYVAAQETLNLWFTPLLSSLSPSSPSADLALTPSNFLVLGHTAFSVSRFLAGALCPLIRPRILLLGSLLCATALSITITALPSSAVAGRPNTLAGLAIGVYFFEGPVFPLIFAMALRGLGRDTKFGAVVIAAATGGGAMGPWVLFAVQTGMGVRRGFWVVAVALGLACLFPGYVELVKRAREVVDWKGDVRWKWGFAVGRLRGFRGVGKRARTKEEGPRDVSLERSTSG